MNFAPLRALFILLSLLVLPASSGLAQDEASEAETAALPAILDSRVTSAGERARLVLDITNPTEFAIYTLAAPDRVVVELRAQSRDGDEAHVAGDGLVADYTIATAGPERVRAEMALTAPARVQQSYILEAFEDQPARLVIDLIPDTAENFAANVREAPAGEAAPAAEATLDGTETAPGETVTADVTVRPLVVIDPGHGGVDGGAKSASGLEEKHIVLAFALKLQSLLVETGKFDVALTREGDSFLTLAERVALARTNRADLFISLHADSFDQEDVRGASIYTRGDIVLDALDRKSVV